MPSFLSTKQTLMSCEYRKDEDMSRKGPNMTLLRALQVHYSVLPLIGLEQSNNNIVN